MNSAQQTSLKTYKISYISTRPSIGHEYVVSDSADEAISVARIRCERQGLNASAFTSELVPHIVDRDIDIFGRDSVSRGEAATGTE